MECGILDLRKTNIYRFLLLFVQKATSSHDESIFSWNSVFDGILGPFSASSSPQILLLQRIHPLQFWTFDHQSLMIRIAATQLTSSGFSIATSPHHQVVQGGPGGDELFKISKPLNVFAGQNIVRSNVWFTQKCVCKLTL